MGKKEKKREIGKTWSMFELREIKCKQSCMIVGLREKKRREIYFE